MRRDKRGRPRNNEIRDRVKTLRKLKYSNQEIAELLRISRQLAVYYAREVDNKLEKE